MHWLVTAATRAAIPGATSCAIPAGASVAGAWEVAARQLGVSQAELARRVAPSLRMKVAELDRREPNARRLLPEKVSRQYAVVALRETDRELVVASSDPNDYAAEQDIGFSSGRRVVFELASPDVIASALSGTDSTDEVVEQLLNNADSTLADAVRVMEEAEPEQVAEKDIQSAPLVKLTNLILSDAVRHGASDIHIEPGGSKGGAVRLRVDGVMRQHMALPMAAVNRIVSRIKVLAKLDIADRMRPQDGRARIQVGGKPYDLRISTVPTRDAEKAVIRILRPDTAKSLQEVGLAAPELQRFRQLIGVRDGIVVVTGPTGSGKTTTLYAAITDIADGTVNVMTVEDPIEYELAGITQIQVEPKRNVTFASALRSILRQDPDVIFVGEIRDAETAEVAAQAAATGHLVLATLHTNDAMSTVSRLLDLGLDRATISAVLRGALAQRLIRRLCLECRMPVGSDRSAEETRLATQFATAPVMRARGCARCGGTGYQGRLPLDEVAIVSPGMAEQIATGATAPLLQRQAIAQGMRPLREVALERVRAGETTLEEVERVLGERADDTPVAESAGPTVLVADDDATILHLATAILEGAGYAVRAVTDGAQALAVLESGTDVSLVITDLRMPGMDGEAIVQRLRANVSTALLPVIVLTGADEQATEVRLMDAGADDYIRKPIDPPLFLARVKAALRRAGMG